MTQQISDLLQRCALLQQMSGTGMPQTVRSASPASDARRLILLLVIFQRLLYPIARYGGFSVRNRFRQEDRGRAFRMYARMASPTSRCRGYFCAPPRLEWFTVNVSARQSKSLNSRRDISPLRNP